MSKHTSAGREARAVRLDSLLVAVLGFGLAGSAAADVKATLVEGFGNTDVFLNDINNKGQAVGSGVVEGTDEEHALVWHKGEAMDIGTLGGPCSAAVALDEGGVHVAGTSDVSSAPFCFSEQHAFLWRDGEMIGLGTLGGPNSFGNDVNKSGVVVG
jgi:probable HAF family extracellular repeat protein